MNMAVPKAGSDDQAFAVNYSGVGRNFDGGGRADGDDAAVMDKDGAIFDGWFCGGRINLCADQSEVVGTNKSAYKKRREEENEESDSHVLNIRVPSEESSEWRARHRPYNCPQLRGVEYVSKTVCESRRSRSLPCFTLRVFIRARIGRTANWHGGAVRGGAWVAGASCRLRAGAGFGSCGGFAQSCFCVSSRGKFLGRRQNARDCFGDRPLFRWRFRQARFLLGTKPVYR